MFLFGELEISRQGYFELAFLDKFKIMKYDPMSAAPMEQDADEDQYDPIMLSKRARHSRPSEKKLYDNVILVLLVLMSIGCVYQIGRFVQIRYSTQTDLLEEIPSLEENIPSIEEAPNTPKIDKIPSTPLNTISISTNTQTAVYSEQYPELAKQTKYEISDIAKKRIQMGKPKPQPRFLSLVTLTNKSKKVPNTCGILNGILVITAKTTKTIQNLFSSGLDKMLLFVDRKDTFADEALKNLKLSKSSSIGQKKKQVIIDSDYEFIRESLQDCKSAVYLQNYFQISKENSGSIIKKLDSWAQYDVQYTKQCTLRESKYQLENLNQVNIGKIEPIQLNKYIFIFDPSLLQIVGPLNFAFYNKYTLEQLLILPLLALTQGSHYLSQISQNLYKLDESFVQFKQFNLRPPPSQASSTQFCFVSYPTNPEISNTQQLQQYIQSIKNIEFVNPASVIVYLPYYMNQASENIEAAIYLLEFLKLAITDNRFQNYVHRIRLILKANSVKSSLSVYQSAYTYCPNKSLIVSSRHNINFHSNFMKDIQGKYSIELHYYLSQFSLRQEQNKDTDSIIRTTLPETGFTFPEQRYKFRDNALYFQQYFSHVQIFKSDLIKMINFEVLKSKQIDFYESQASFVLPMLEMIRLNVGLIRKQGFNITLRQKTTAEQENIKNLKKYFEFMAIPNNLLNPYPFDSLGNVAFRRNAPDRIPKNLHQIWIGDEQPSQFRLKLHETLKLKNQNYTVFFWKEENLTEANFPITHSLVHRSLIYNKESKRSYLAPISSLIRYEALLNHGGVYLDFKAEGLKPLDPFLKYQIFFTDATVDQQRYGNPNYLGNPIMGAQLNSYYLNFILTELITQQNFNYDDTMFPKIAGAYVLRRAFQTRQIFTNIGMGFHLFSPRPVLDDLKQQQSLCLKVDTFRDDQKVYEVTDNKTGQNYKIGIPCYQYPQAYAIQYRPLGRTWVGPKN